MVNTITIDKFYDTKSYLTPIQLRLIEVLRNGPACRKALVKKLNTPRTTIYDNLLKLQKRKLEITMENAVDPSFIGSLKKGGQNDDRIF